MPVTCGCGGGCGSHRRERSPAMVPNVTSFYSHNDYISGRSPSVSSSLASCPLPHTPGLNIKGQKPDQNKGYSRRVSAEVLKVLNGIWRLEESHATNLLLTTTLKQELHHARSTIEHLLTDLRSDRRKIRSLRKKITRGREAELSHLRSSLSDAVTELERERKRRVKLEDLCDEFARAVKNYSSEVRFLKARSEEAWAVKGDSDRMLLHVSESWLDERSLVGSSTTSGRVSSIDRLRPEIEAFLHSSSCTGSSFRRMSPELFHPAGAGGGVGGKKKMNHQKQFSNLRCCARNELQNFLKRDEYYFDYEDEMPVSGRLLPPLVEGRKMRGSLFSKSGTGSSEYGA